MWSFWGPAPDTHVWKLLQPGITFVQWHTPSAQTHRNETVSVISAHSESPLTFYISSIMGTVKTDGLDHYCWFPGAITYCVTGCNVAGINSTSADRPDLSAHTWIHEVVVGVDDVMDKLVSLPVTIQNLGKKYPISTHSTSALVVFISHFSQGPGYISLHHTWHRPCCSAPGSF